MPSNQIQKSKISIVTKFAIVLGICAFIGIVWLIKQHYTRTEPPQQESSPEMFKHQGEEYIIPQNSPLKNHIKVANVGAAIDGNLISFPGIVEANTAATANIEPPLSGRLVKLYVKVGDHVQKGQVLAMMSSGDLAQAYSDVSKAKDSLNLADVNLKRAQQVNEIGANANKDLEASQSAQIQAKYEYLRAEQRLKTLAGHTSKISGSEALLAITSPISGDITTLNVGVGSFMNDNTTAIMTITNLDQVWVSANIPEAQLSEVHTGSEVDVSLPAYPNQIFHGRINNISNVLDSDTRRTKARVLLNNNSIKLKPNMFATVQIKNLDQQKISVPQSALLMNNEKVTVFVETKPNIFVRKTVELGNENETNVQITSGLNPSDKIIVSGGVLLND